MKQKEKWATIGELSAWIAHELRNPIASLRGSIEMLREGRIDNEHNRRLMDIALREMDRLNNIITDFLIYARPRPLNSREVDVHSILKETLTLLRNSAGESVKITHDFNGDLRIKGDEEQLRQVFWNLGINAIDAMTDGDELMVSTRSDGSETEVIFKDSGIGIPKGDIGKIFLPFFTTKEKGTGLGLAIAYRIVEEHGGRISVKSMPGAGTTFKVFLKRDGKTQG